MNSAKKIVSSLVLDLDMCILLCVRQVRMRSNKSTHLSGKSSTA